MSIFGLYARYYDLLYQDKDYHGEAEYIDRLIKRHYPAAQTLLELGCGTGAHAEHLVQKGYSVFGIDMSPDMLASANNRRSGLHRELANRLEFSQGDVRSFRNEKKYDVVLSLFHVFSYQTSNTDLLAALETAATHLNPGGVLIFDYWFGPAVLTQKPETRIKRLEDKSLRVLRIAESEMLPNENRVTVNYSIFIGTDGNNNYQKLEEQHHMRYLFIPEIETLSFKWFSAMKHMAWMKESNLSVDDWSGVSILVRKP